MTDDDGDDDTMEGRLAHILESDAMDTVDLWLTIVACLAAIETLYVCALATYRYSRRIYHLPLQRWTIRVLLVGPVYSVLMWVALWYPSLDFYLAVPLGFYECYAFFGFYAMLACFADGEDRLATALGSLNPGPPTAYLYHPFGFNWCSCRCDNYSPLFWGNIHYAALPLKFGSSRELLRFLNRGVAQAMIVKPCSLLLMLTLEYLGYESLQRDALAQRRQLLVRRELDHAVVPCRVAADTGLGGRTPRRFTARHGVGAGDPGRRHFYFFDPGGGDHGADGRAADAAGGDTDDSRIYGLLDDFLSATPAGEVPYVRAAERRVAGAVAVAPEHVPHEIRGRRPGPVDDRVEIKK